MNRIETYFENDCGEEEECISDFIVAHDMMDKEDYSYLMRVLKRTYEKGYQAGSYE